MGKGAANRRKGHNAERYYMIFFKDMGFKHCSTSRYASRRYDNGKIDLVYVPFNIQIKAGKQKNMNAGKVLFEVENCVKAMFPPEEKVHQQPYLLFHYKQGTPGKKRKPEDEIVFMSLKQFKVFNEKTNNNDLKFLGSKSFKFKLNSDFKDVVWMTFEYFTENILKPLYLC